MLAIYKKELRTYFTSAIGYVFLVIFLAVGGAIFCLSTIYAMSASVTNFYTYMMLFSAVMLPILTMKSFSEERKIRTEQLLLTSPVSLTGMVLGKFFAAFTMFAGALVVCSLYFLFLTPYAAVKFSLLFCNLIALLLVGMTFIAIGMFVSSLTENQLAAAVGTMAILLVLLAVGLLNQLIGAYWLRFLIGSISIFTRFQTFTNGYFDLASLVYYLTVCAIFLYLTVRVYDRRRHNG